MGETVSYSTDLGSNPFIIDDSNADKLVTEWREEGYSFGMTQRDYRSIPFGSASKPASYQYQFESNRQKLIDRIKRADDLEATPDHWRIKGEVPILDQNGYGYCWCYATIGAVMTCYAMTGRKSPILNPFMTAWIGKNFRDQGGWGEEALRYIEQLGIVEAEYWPEHSTDRSLIQNENVKTSAAKHKVTQSLELPPNEILALVSVLTDPVMPRPVVLGLPWWGHEVYGVRAGYKDGQFLVKIANSWKFTWGEQGCAWLTEKKATAAEQIAIQRCKVLR